MNPARLSGAAAVAILCAATASLAQTASPAPMGRVVITGALRLTPASSLGRSSADLTPGSGQPAYPLFSASGTLDAHAGGEAGLGWRVSRTLRLLFVGAVARPVVGVRIEGDAEGAPDLDFDGESLWQWSAGGRVEYDLNAWRFASGRAVPFLTGGFGLFWQTHESGMGTESGQTIDAGGGLRYVVRSKPASLVSSMAVVADVRVSRVTGGVRWDTSARTVPSAGIGIATAWGRVRKAA